MTTKTAQPTVLSVLEAVAYIDEHYWDRECRDQNHLFSESTLRRLLKNGRLPSARTARGHLGIKASDVDAYFARYER